MTFDVSLADIQAAATRIAGKVRRTPFGVTNVGDPALSRVARKLGATYCRHFTGWSGLEPLPGQYRLEGLDKTIAANVEAGIVPWICLIGPPAWAMADEHHSAGYEPFTFKADAWRNLVHTLATRYSVDVVASGEDRNVVHPHAVFFRHRGSIRLAHRIPVVENFSLGRLAGCTGIRTLMSKPAITRRTASQNTHHEQ